MTEDIRVGDWVRFYRHETLVLGVVAYVYPRTDNKQAIIQTDNGAIKGDRVLEIRRQSATGEN